MESSVKWNANHYIRVVDTLRKLPNIVNIDCNAVEIAQRYVIRSRQGKSNTH